VGMDVNINAFGVDCVGVDFLLGWVGVGMDVGAFSLRMGAFSLRMGAFYLRMWAFCLRVGVFWLPRASSFTHMGDVLRATHL